MDGWLEVLKAFQLSWGRGSAQITLNDDRNSCR
ncbi:hypothetical protein KR49_02655 [Synechococcus sp. KORDI-49]|nr:hypothetical protein KR49_02655 [Synechococcus sp. KORDI-49]